MTSPTSRFVSWGAPSVRRHGHVLGVVRYASAWSGPALVQGVPQLTVQTAHAVDEAFSEVWETGRPVRAGEQDGLCFGHDGEFLFCAGRVPPGGRYAEAAEAAYLAAFRLTERLGYPELLRMWNFVAHINAPNADGLEGYRDFCLGRARAFERWETQMPAATGVGALGGGVGFCFLASKSVGRVNVENPGQTPAYRYSEAYGPKPPSFARATWVRPTGSTARGHVFVSGTASIVGEDTVHEHDLERQCAVSLDNIARLIGARNLRAHGIDQGHTLADLRGVKVYVRHRQDLAFVRRRCLEVFAPDAEVAFLNVDLCRQNLLVEIEGLVMPDAPRPGRS